MVACMLLLTMLFAVRSASSLVRVSSGCSLVVQELIEISIEVFLREVSLLLLEIVAIKALAIVVVVVAVVASIIVVVTVAAIPVSVVVVSSIATALIVVNDEQG